MSDKFCINCKHYVQHPKVNKQELGKCANNHPISLVTGLPADIDSLPYCNVLRLPQRECGVEGKLWEKKEASNV